jgi:hypothetical protein
MVRQGICLESRDPPPFDCKHNQTKGEIMVRRIFLTAVWFTVLATFVPLAAMAGEAENQQAALLGCWQCNKAGDLAALIFHSSNLLSQDGEYYQYMLIPGAIRVSDGYEFADFYYQTDGVHLVALYPDGSQINCMRSACASLVTSRSQPAGPPSGGYSSGSGSGSGGNDIVMPSFGGGSWATEGDIQFHNDSSGYGGGAYENPSSNYYDYNE